MQRNRRAEDRKIVIMWGETHCSCSNGYAFTWTSISLSSYISRKQHIEQQLQELQQRNDELEQEKAKLQDPKNIENVAREQLGLVKPGEVPYVK